MSLRVHKIVETVYKWAFGKHRGFVLLHEMVIYGMVLALLTHTAAVYTKLLAVQSHYQALQECWQQAQLTLAGDDTILHDDMQITKETVVSHGLQILEVTVKNGSVTCFLAQAEARE